MNPVDVIAATFPVNTCGPHGSPSPFLQPYEVIRHLSIHQFTSLCKVIDESARATGTALMMQHGDGSKLRGGAGATRARKFNIVRIVTTPAPDSKLCVWVDLGGGTLKWYEFTT